MVTYATWLNRVFGRTAKQPAPLFEEDPETICELIRMTLARSGEDLTRFSDKQVNQGLHLIFSSSHHLVQSIGNPLVPAQTRSATVLAIKTLYAECFAKRAQPVLSHLDEKPTSPLNSICYMLWDTTPISMWGHVAGCEYFDLSLEVLAFALYLPHPACVESALHGLGHIGGGTVQRVQQMIEQWLTRNPTSRPELRTYAQFAYKGVIR